MADINLTTGIVPSTQIPLDSKRHFQTLALMLDLGTSDANAFLYYEGMIAFCVQTQKTYQWRETPLFGRIPSVLPNGFDYPAVHVVDGVDYGGKNFNFFEQVESVIPRASASDEILSGSVYWTGVELNHESTIISYKINGEEYSAPATSKTLTAADATLHRIDLFAVTIDQELIVIEGTPAANPTEPSLNFASQIRVKSSLIPAAATIPEGSSTDSIYNENLGNPNEWNTSLSTAAGGIPTSIVFNSVAQPSLGSLSIEGIDVRNSDLMIFDAPAAKDMTLIDSLAFDVYNKAAVKYNWIIKFYNGSIQIGSISILPMSSGWDPSNITSYGTINIPIADVLWTSREQSVNRIVINVISEESSKNNIGFYLDRIRLLSTSQIVSAAPSATLITTKVFDLGVINNADPKISLGASSLYFDEYTQPLIKYTALNGIVHLTPYLGSRPINFQTTEYVPVASDLGVDMIIDKPYYGISNDHGALIASVTAGSFEEVYSYTDKTTGFAGTIFNLDYLPVPGPASLGFSEGHFSLYKNGILMLDSDEYSKSSTQITMVDALIVTDVIIAKYFCVLAP